MGKPNYFGIRPGPTQSRLKSKRSRLEALNFRLRKERHCTIRVAKTITAQLISACDFAYDDWFLDAAAQIK